MSNYVPRFRKKQETRDRREYDLIAKLAEGADEIVVLKAAHEVRLARTRALKEQLAKLPPVEGKKAHEFHRLEERIQIATQTTVNEILSEFQQLAKKEQKRRERKTE